MNQSFSRKLTITSLVAALAIAAGGCAAPGARGDRDRVATEAPQPPSMAGMTSSPMSGAARSNASLPNTTLASESAWAAAPASSNHQSEQTARYGADNSSVVAQAGHFVPARLQGSCGCGACGSPDCRSCPQGYVMQSPEGWNAYGLDPQEFLCDGGDRMPAATLRRDDSIAGLGLEDTVVHYTTESGDIHFQPSNHTCLYAPRFTSVRKITGAVAGGRAIGLGGVDLPVGPIRVEHDLPRLVMTEATELGHADVARRTDAMRDRNRGVPVEGVLQPEQAADVMAALAALKLFDLGQTRDSEIAILEKLAQAAISWTMDESLEVVVQDLKAPTLTRDQRVDGFTIYDFPDAGRLQIVKLADRSDALPGEIVAFAIRIDNVGDSSVNHVVLTDNLTTRLEYVPDSQTCEGSKAEFTSVMNEGQSLKLQWKLSEELPVGASVTIRFECKVR